MIIEINNLEEIKQKIVKLHEIEIEYLAASEKVNSFVNSGLLNDAEIAELGDFVASLRKRD